MTHDLIFVKIVNTLQRMYGQVFANNETHEYCCFSCYLRHPTIIPTESKFKSTGNELVILPNLRQCINENITDDEKMMNTTTTIIIQTMTKIQNMVLNLQILNLI